MTWFVIFAPSTLFKRLLKLSAFQWSFFLSSLTPEHSYSQKKKKKPHSKIGRTSNFNHQNYYTKFVFSWCKKDTNKYILKYCRPYIGCPHLVLFCIFPICPLESWKYLAFISFVSLTIVIHLWSTAVL